MQHQVSAHKMECVGDDGSRLIISSILLRKIASSSLIDNEMFNRLDLLCCSSQDLVRLEALPISGATRSCTLSADVPGRLGILMLLRNGEHYNINHKRVCRSNSMYDQLNGLFELCSSLPSWWEMTKRGVAETRGVNSLESKWRRIILFLVCCPRCQFIALTHVLNISALRLLPSICQNSRSEHVQKELRQSTHRWYNHPKYKVLSRPRQ